MILKKRGLGLGQSPFADETEVGRKTLRLWRPKRLWIFNPQRVQRHFTYELFRVMQSRKRSKHAGRWLSAHQLQGI